MESNVAELCGVVLSEPKFSHKTYGEIFYTFELGIERRSGYIDEIRIMISERLIFDHTPRLKDFVEIKGQIRTYNELAENHNKLHIVVFAKEIYFSENFGYNENYIYLEGFLCKPPLKRTSPLGREICDLMLAVNRRYGRADYLPCIAWGALAQSCGQLSVGDPLRLEGRLQSRTYQKLVDGVPQDRTAFEVSIMQLAEF